MEGPSTVDDAQGPALASSELQIRPPPSPNDLDRFLFHVPLEEFGARLQRAAQAVFPNNPKSRYSNVHVLLLHWKDGDPNLPVVGELNELRDVFKDYYHFETECWQIPSKNAHRALNRKITEFVELEDDSRDCLKIVYYGGHGLLSPSRQLMWSNLANKDDPQYQSIKWHAIQATLEDAESDILLLLDCCAAGTASTDNGHGVTELLGACAFNNTANGVGEFSFTTALCKELRAFSRVPSFTVGRLYNNLLRRTQLTLSHMTLQKAPVHVVLTQDYKLPRSIQLCPIPLKLDQGESAVRLLGGLEVSESSSSATETDESRGSSILKAIISESDSESSRSSRTSVSSCNKMYPRIVLSVQLPGNIRPNQLSEDLFREWLRMIPVVAENVKVEAGWTSFSTLIIVSVPMLIWGYIEEHPAVKMIGIIRSPSLLKKQVQLGDYPLLMGTSSDYRQNFKKGLNTVERWFEQLRKRNQREVLFRLHDLRSAKKSFPGRVDHPPVEESMDESSNYWGSEADSETIDDLNWDRNGGGWSGQRTGHLDNHSDQGADLESRTGLYYRSSADVTEPGNPDSAEEERRRSRSRTRSSVHNSGPGVDAELSVVQSREKPGNVQKYTSYPRSDERPVTAVSGSPSGSRIISVNTGESYRRLQNETGVQDLTSAALKPGAEAVGISEYEKFMETKDSKSSLPIQWPQMYSDSPLTVYRAPSPHASGLYPPQPPSVTSESQSSTASSVNYSVLSSHDSAGIAGSADTSTVSPGTPSEAENRQTVTPHISQTQESGYSFTREVDRLLMNLNMTSSALTPIQIEEYSGGLSSRELQDKYPTKLEEKENLTFQEQSIPGSSPPHLNQNAYPPDPITNARRRRDLVTPFHKKQLRVVTTPTKEVSGEKKPMGGGGILHQQQPRGKSAPADHHQSSPIIRESVVVDAPPPLRLKDPIPSGARLTKINRRLVNPEALEAGKERYETREDFVIVMRALSREEVRAYAVVTQHIRAAREEVAHREKREHREARIRRFAAADDDV